MRKTLYFLGLLFLFANINMLTASPYILGIVLTEDMKPIKGALVSIIGAGYESSNSLGEFKINLPQSFRVGDKIMLSVEKEGYEVTSPGHLSTIIPRDPVGNPLRIILRKDSSAWVIGKNQRLSDKVQLITTQSIVCGKIKLDTIFNNRSNESIILSKLVVDSHSSSHFVCKSTFPRGLDVIATYSIRFHVNKGNIKIMEPPLFIPAGAGARFGIVLSPVLDGACQENIPFQFKVLFFAGNEVIVETPKYKANYRTLAANQKKAIRQYKEDVRDRPDNIYALCRLARISEKKEAITLYKKIIQLAPDDSESFFQLANLLSYDSYEDTVHFFEKAVNLDRKIAAWITFKIINAYENYIEELIESGKLKQAEELLVKLQTYSPPSSNINILFARIYGERENCRKVIEFLEKEKQNMLFIEWLTRNDFYNLNRLFPKVKGCKKLMEFLRKLNNPLNK